MFWLRLGLAMTLVYDRSVTLSILKLKNLVAGLLALVGHVSVETTERYLGSKQKLRHAVNDTMGLEPKVG